MLNTQASVHSTHTQPSMPRCFMSAVAKLGGNKEEQEQEDDQQQELGVFGLQDDRLHRIKNINIDIDRYKYKIEYRI